MRAFAILIGLIATLAGSYAGYTVMRAVGPDNETGNFGFGDAALSPPGGGTLLQSKNFPLVVQALERELGSDGGVTYLNVEIASATGTGKRSDGREVSVQIDASGRSRANETGGDDNLTATLPVSKLDPAAIDTMIKAARKETGVPVESLRLQGSSREWTVEMLRGEPDSFLANLDGGGLRLSGEENPEPIGGSPDSLLRAKNLQKVLDAAAKEGDDLLDIDVRPDRVSLALKSGGRQVQLSYGYDGQLTGRDVAALSGNEPTMKLSQIDAKAIERMAKHPKVKQLGNIQYVLLRPRSVFTDKLGLATYLAKGMDPTYVSADLHGRHITWPGKG
jgi:hypothetical protein